MARPFEIVQVDTALHQREQEHNRVDRWLSDDDKKRLELCNKTSWFGVSVFEKKDLGPVEGEGRPKIDESSTVNAEKQLADKLRRDVERTAETPRYSNIGVPLLIVSPELKVEMERPNGFNGALFGQPAGGADGLKDYNYGEWNWKHQLFGFQFHSP